MKRKYKLPIVILCLFTNAIVCQQKNNSSINLNEIYNSFQEKSLGLNCPNASIEQGNFNNWIGGTYTKTAYTPWTFPIPYTSGFSNQGNNSALTNSLARHTIMTTPPGNNNPGAGAIVGYDPLCRNLISGLYDLPLLYPGSNVSVRLGNRFYASGGNGVASMMSYSMNVTSVNSQFLYKYAVVLSHGYHATTDQEAFFSVKLKDAAGNDIGGNCSQYFTRAGIAAGGTEPSFKMANVSGVGGTVYYKNWSQANIDLTPFVGQTVTIVFEVADCIYQAHFGYAYLSLDCGQAQSLTSVYCPGNPTASLVVPNGYSTYQWQGPNNHNNISGATSNTLTVTNPAVNDTFYVQLTNASGCSSVMQTIITSPYIKAILQSTIASCSGNTGAISIINNPAYTYTWSSAPAITGTIYGNGSSVTGLNAGIIYLRIQNGSCGYKDTSFTIPAAGSQLSNQSVNFCDASNTWLIAGIGSNYKWYSINGNVLPINNNDSLLITNPINNAVYFVGFTNSFGCRDSIKFILSESVISVSQQVQNNPCHGTNLGSINLTPSPSYTYSYNWFGPSGFTSTNSGNSSILNNLISGTYSCIISNSICSKTLSISIIEPSSPLDTLAITTSFCEADEQAICIAPSGYTNYQWYNNGNLISGAQNESIIIDNPNNYQNYTVWFTITPCRYKNEFSVKTNSIIDKETEQVNVFTPNGDKANDVFFPIIDKSTLKPFLSNFIADFTLEIYNRWGQKIYQSSNYNEGWNGKNGSEFCGDGVYFWTINYKMKCSNNDASISKNGVVTLFK